MIYAIGDLVRYQGMPSLVIGSYLGENEDEDSYCLSNQDEWIPGKDLALIFKANEGTVKSARNEFYGNAKPPPGVEVAVVEKKPPQRLESSSVEL